MVDATEATVKNEAELVAASARFLWPLARGYLAVSVQDLMAADNERQATIRPDGRCVWIVPTRDLTLLLADP